MLTWLILSLFAVLCRVQCSYVNGAYGAYGHRVPLLGTAYHASRLYPGRPRAAPINDYYAHPHHTVDPLLTPSLAPAPEVYVPAARYGPSSTTEVYPIRPSTGYSRPEPEGYPQGSPQGDSLGYSRDHYTYGGQAAPVVEIGRRPGYYADRRPVYDYGNGRGEYQRDRYRYITPSTAPDRNRQDRF